MTLLSKRLELMTESATLEMARKSRELKAKGIDIISLSLGEPDFNTPDFIKEAAKKAIDENFTKYPPVNGYLDLREAIAHKFKRDNHLNYTADNIVVSTGAKQSIINAVMSLVNEGDEVIIPTPFWVSYEEMVKLAGGKCVFINATIEHDFKITSTQLEAAITPKTKLMIFSSPCNPTGSVYTQQELEALAQVLKKHKNIYVISDEIYEHINFTGKHASIAAVEGMFDNVITVNGVSKAFCMTGWRIGFIGASKQIATACNKLQGQFTSGASSIAQRASLAAMQADPKVVEPMREAFLKRRDLVLNLLKDVPGMVCNVPTGAFYVFPKVNSFFGKSFNEKKISNAEELCLFLLEDAKVALVTGEAFGDPNCVRISYATGEAELTEAMKRIKHSLAKLA
ncbi:MAG TPA: pyridoxal phosphate-dependent aminotransferase [Flavobacteriales bacterium]|nr:pyridoxal phosphate-dependent aminotransferase [Flavobacteriales bacterium]